MKSCPPCTPAALRQRRYRERLRKGHQIVHLEVDQDWVEHLLARRLLKVDEAGDPKAISRAIVEDIRLGVAA